MKRTIVGLGLLVAACSPKPTGTLGPAPTGPSPTTAITTTTTTTTVGITTTTTGRPLAPSTAVPPARTFSFEAWFVRAGKLLVTRRTEPFNAAAGRVAMTALLEGPSGVEQAAGVRTQIPDGTKLLGLQIAGGVATVDLTPTFESTANASTMPLRLAQVVYTITQYPTVSSVRFKIGGQGRTVVGGVPVQDPQTRAIDQGYLPAITVERPSMGEQVSSPVTVSGTADVFEATVSIQVLDSTGSEIARSFTTATCGTGCRGDYSVGVPYSVPRQEPGTIEVFERSAKDGSRVNVQLIPVTLTP